MDEHEKKHHFFVDAKRFETEMSSLTGAEIKAKAEVTATYQLFLEEEGDTPDRPISDGETVVLKEGRFRRSSRSTRL